MQRKNVFWFLLFWIVRNKNRTIETSFTSLVGGRHGHRFTAGSKFAIFDGRAVYMARRAVMCLCTIAPRNTSRACHSSHLVKSWFMASKALMCLSGGNLVDGLPPAPRIIFLRGLVADHFSCPVLSRTIFNVRHEIEHSNNFCKIIFQSQSCMFEAFLTLIFSF